VRGYFDSLPQFAASCPLPSATALVPDAKIVATLNDTNATYPDLLSALRTLAAVVAAEGPWGARFAMRLNTATDGFNPKVCKQVWKVGFAQVSSPLPFQNDCGCAFIGASDGDEAYQCYRFPQPGQATQPACAVPRLGVYDFPDWNSAARALRFYDLADRALTTLGKTCREKVIARLDAAEGRWQALAKNGLVQFPWELWISRLVAPESYANYTACFAVDKSCNGEQGLDPNRVRAIFLHPGIGLGFPGFGVHDGAPQAKAHAVVALEVAGATLYPDSFKWYLGLSAGLGFQDADFADPRLGGFVHVTRWLQAGYLHGVRSRSKHDGTLYLSVDALGWLNPGWLDP
jgi:hypothetical protein